MVALSVECARVCVCVSMTRSAYASSRSSIVAGNLKVRVVSVQVWGQRAKNSAGFGASRSEVFLMEASKGGVCKRLFKTIMQLLLCSIARQIKRPRARLSPNSASTSARSHFYASLRETPRRQSRIGRYQIQEFCAPLVVHTHEFID